MKELYTRINFFVASVISIIGITLIYEIVTEDDPIDKLDDALMLILGAVAVWWYKKSGHKGTTAMPAVWISGLAVLIKILAVVVEHADKEALGDDIGILLAVILVFGLVVWQVFFTKKSAK